MKKPLIYLSLAALLVVMTPIMQSRAALAVSDNLIYLPLVMKQATGLPSGVHVLSNYTNYVDSADYLHIVGEVFNNTDSNLWFVKISVNVFDSGGHLVATDFTYTDMNTLAAKDKTCFDVLMPNPTAWSYFQVEPVTYYTGAQTLPNLTIYDVSDSYDSTFGWYEIIGMVINNMPTTVTYVEPVGTLYDAQNKVIGCDYTFVNSTDLSPGQSSAFKLTFWGRDYSDVGSYRLQTDGSY